MNCKRKIDKAATGLKLYRLIKESGLTYAEIAEFLELQTPRVIYDWINGNKLPSIENLYNLAELFNVQIEDILRFLRVSSFLYRWYIVQTRSSLYNTCIRFNYVLYLKHIRNIETGFVSIDAYKHFC